MGEYERALKFATKKHEGQYRKGGEPYITHPIAVSNILKEKGYGIEYQITALFHDLLEDTDATREEIETLGGKEVLKAVELLTKYEDYQMEEYVSNIRKNPIAFAVKGADRLHNLLSAVDTDESFKRRYILESIDWYLDFSEEIPKAVKALVKTLDQPIRKMPLEYDPVHSAKELKANAFVLKGDICYSVSLTELVTVSQGYVVCIEGKSQGVYEILPDEYSKLPLYDYGHRLILPGMVDLHIHAPQFAFRGLGMDDELMVWLQKQTFPEESKYQDLEYARKAYTQFCDAMHKSATTHACVFGTKHRDATIQLMELMEKSGLVSYVGKVNMDRDAPEALCEPSADYSAYDTFGWINQVHGRFHHTKPILTPRFIPCCTNELLEQLREIQIAYDLPIQSHLSENIGEVEWVHQIRPDVAFYGDAYHDYGLFGIERRSGKKVPTIMAHCVYSTEEEVDRLLENGVYVAHCPTSNVNLSSGIAPVRKYLKKGLKIGLGSDVAGGHTESMFEVMKETIQVSKLYWRYVDQKDAPITFKEAFYLATKGGGSFFGNVGSFEKGYDFSAIVLDESTLPHPQELSLIHRLERAVYGSLDQKGLVAKYVDGSKLFDEKEGLDEK